MATIREGDKEILLIVDAQVGVMQNSWNSKQIIKNIGLAVEKAREQGIPVIWVQHSDDELIYDSPDWQIVPELSPAAKEERIHKRYNSSFENTSLEGVLSQLGITHIILAGAATNWCIRATAYSALDRGYDLTLIKDAHTTESIELENGSILEATTIIRELNITMNWLCYPDRTNAAISVEALEFARSRPTTSITE